MSSVRELAMYLLQALLLLAERVHIFTGRNCAFFGMYSYLGKYSTLGWRSFLLPNESVIGSILQEIASSNKETNFPLYK